MGYVTPHSWHNRNEISGSSMIGGGEILSFSHGDPDFTFSSKFLEDEQGTLSPPRMSSADELFHDGKIRPLQPVAHFKSVSFYQEQPVTARLEVHEDYAFRWRAEYSAGIPPPIFPLSPKLQQMQATRDDTRSYVHDSGVSTKQEMEREEHKDPPDKPVAILNLSVAPQRSSSNVFFRKLNSFSRLHKVFHMSQEPVSDMETKDCKRSEESATARENQTELPKTPIEQQDRAGRTKSTSKSGKTLEDLLKKDPASRTEAKVSARKANSGRQRASWARSNSELLTTAQGESMRIKQQSAISPDQPWRSKRPDSPRSPKRGNGASPHERHYASQRDLAERMKKKTSLPYRQSILGCLGFNSVAFRSGHPLYHHHPGNNHHLAVC